MQKIDASSPEFFPEWDMSIPALPPRSRCYQLEPIGVGTAWVEGLTGYVARLAATHQVTLKALINLEILPWQEKVEPTSLSYARVKAFWNTRAPSQWNHNSSIRVGGDHASIDGVRQSPLSHDAVLV